MLQPWLVVLDRFWLEADLPSLPTVSDTTKLWFRVTTPHGNDNTPTRWILLAEAMELLELLARVDHRAAWHLLFEVARKEHLVQQYGDEPMPSPNVLPRFELYIEDDFLLEFGQQTMFGLLRLIVQSSKQSSGYQEVKQTMLRKFAGTHDGQVFDRETHGRVKLSLTFDIAINFGDETAIRGVFRQITAVLFAHKNPSSIRPGMGPDERDVMNPNRLPTGAARASIRDVHRGHREARPRRRGAFVFESYRILISSLENVPNLVIYLINEAARVGLPLSHFAFNNVVAAQLHHSVIGDFLMNLVVPWAGRREPMGIQNLKLDMGIFDATAVRTFSSAIVCSHSLREFTFDQSFGAPEHVAFGVEAGSSVWWPWLAYALSSRDATHKIDSVTLNMRGLLSTAVIETVRMVLHANDPSKLLYQASGLGADAPDGKPPVAATFNKTANLWLGHRHEFNPNPPDKTPMLAVEEPGVTYHVVRDHPDEDFVEFVLPGAGVAWTQRSELIEMQLRPRRSSHTIRHLTLKDVDKGEVQTTIAFVELIG